MSEIDEQLEDLRGMKAIEALSPGTIRFATAVATAIGLLIPAAVGLAIWRATPAPLAVSLLAGYGGYSAVVSGPVAWICRRFMRRAMAS